MSASRWLPEARMSSRYSCLLLVDLAEHPLAEHLREADDRVQRRPQLVRHVRQELRLVPARGLELAALLVQLAECRLELAGPLLDLLLEARVRLLELRDHPIELLGERAQLVVGSDVDPLVQRAGADPRRRGLHRLDRPGQPAREQDARPDSQGRNATSSSAVRWIVESSGRERLAQRLLDEHPPSGRSIVWYALSTSVPSGSRPVVTEPATGAPSSKAVRTCGSPARLVRFSTRLMSRWAMSLPRRVDRVRVAGRADARL